MRDSQRSKVYRWEWSRQFETALNTCPEEKRLTLDECQLLVNKIWQRYRTDDPPVVTDGRGCRRALAGWYDIKLPRWARRSETVCHEVAHALLRRWEQLDKYTGVYRPALPGHGPEFVALLIEILSYARRASREALRRSAHEHGVKVAYYAACPRPRKRSKEVS